MEKYELKKYVEKLDEEGILLNKNELTDILKRKVYQISINSTNVIKESMFMCKGNSFKEEYLKEAISKGAFVYVSQKRYTFDAYCILVSDIRKAMAICSNIYYNNSKDKLNIIGITGTKGKSTTSYYIKYILDEMSKENLGKLTGIISSIKTYDGKSNDYSLLTTPESIEINERFHNMVDSNIRNVVMEVSSQALKYDRTYEINFNIGVFLNISEDHISAVEHKDFEDYFSSKLKIFKQCNIACVNLDCSFSDRVYDEARKYCKEVITFSLKDKNATIYAKNVEKQGFSTKFLVKTPKWEREFILNMSGLFNVENALAAIAVSYVLGIDTRFIYSGLSLAKTEGRMELFSSKDSDVISLVDYAHNKLSFEKVFESVKEEFPNRNIVCVFGCPGDKAVNRRVDLPKVADKYSTKIYLTADDPGSEKVSDICNQISSNIKNTQYTIIEDRKTAIKEAIRCASKNSIILVLGKGAEKLQKYGDKKEEYLSDIYYVKKYLNELVNDKK